MRQFYPAVVDKDVDSDYGISFPDFPGCISAGDTVEEAMEMGAEALQFHVDGMAEDGDPIPRPTRVENVTFEPDATVVCVTMIPVALPGKAKRVNITMDEGLLAEIDALASNRSRFLAEAARAEIARRRAVG